MSNNRRTGDHEIPNKRIKLESSSVNNQLQREYDEENLEESLYNDENVDVSNDVREIEDIISRENTENNRDDHVQARLNSAAQSDSEFESDVDDDDYEEEDDEVELDQSEIHDMLDEGLRLDSMSSQPSASTLKVKIDKTVMDRGRTNHFEVLPNNWIEVTHYTGLTVYLHKTTRVVSLCRPYLLGQGSKLHHRIPISSIPCLDYKRQIEENKEQERSKVQIKEGDIEKAILTGAKVESVDENTEKNSLSAEQITNYCKKLFPSKRVIVKSKAGKKSQERPTLPSGTILITVPVYDSNTKTMSTRDWALNPNGKTSVCVLHEYLQRALKKGPVYEYREKENSKTPYQASLKINDVIYGNGIAASKKQAKLEAAKMALEVLIPQLKSVDLDKESKNSCSSNGDNKYSIFDTIHITDPKVADCCAKSTEPSPYTMLLKCLERNYGIGENKKINYTLQPTRHNRILFKMQAGKHSASAVCKNKKEGKQLASQQILQDLHPSIQYWGSLLRLYGNESMSGMRQKKHQEQEITKLQNKATINSPNHDVLEKLKSELRKLAVERETLESKESFKLPFNIELPSTSSCEANLNFDVASPGTSSDSE